MLDKLQYRVFKLNQNHMQVLIKDKDFQKIVKIMSTMDDFYNYFGTRTITKNILIISDLNLAGLIMSTNITLIVIKIAVIPLLLLLVIAPLTMKSYASKQYNDNFEIIFKISKNTPSLRDSLHC